jgi:23S rRNA pseudouridine1911/1915/1917 synthase
VSEPSIIYEDKHFLVVNKPAGLIVHHVKGKEGIREESTLTGWLLEHYPELASVGDDPVLRPGIVHRLDKETSGVMLVPRDQKYFEYLKSLFGKHEIEKTYLALVLGQPKEKEGTIDAPIGIRTGTTKRSVRSSKMAKSAITQYRVMKTFLGSLPAKQKFSLLEVRPKTGRTHQIRVHLASIGHPIVGDKLYGPRNGSSEATRLMLHALALEFVAEDGKRLRFEAEPPIEFSYPQGDTKP